MKRIVSFGLLALACIAVSACGSGDKTAPTVAPSTTATPAASAIDLSGGSRVTLEAGDGAAGDDGDILSLLLSNGLGSGDVPSPAGAKPGDPALERYLLQSGDLPAGYRIVRTTNLSAGDGISDTGTVDMATSIAERGTTGSPDADMLVSMVMRFSDLQDLEKSFSQVDADAIKAQLATAGGQEFEGLFKDVRTLDTGDLGDHASGVTMTMDLSSLFGSFAEAFSGISGTPVALPTGIPSGFTIRMYLFARGSYGGAVMHVYAADQHIDELSLARIIDRRLADAER
jgi:hypothetical protein